MINKWILGSTLSTLIGILAAAVYLVLIQPGQDGSNLPHYHAEWLLWFFLVMVAVSMVMNLSVFIASPAQWQSVRKVFKCKEQQQQLQVNHYQHQIQLFLQQQQLQLQRLTCQADIYIWFEPATPVLMQFAEAGEQQPGIAEMRQLFRWMLAHQCRQSYYLSMQAPNLQAEIFAKEAGITFVDVDSLQKLQSRAEN